MNSVSTGRTVTLLLQGGHTIKLDTISNVQEIVTRIEKPTGELIEIQTQTSDRLLIREDSLLGIYETADTQQTVSIKTHVQIENFLSREDHQRIISRALQAEVQFEHSQVTTGRDNYRKSLLLIDDNEIGPMFRHLLKRRSVEVAQSLGLELVSEPEDDQIECQVTAHRDGGFFHAHSDSGAPSTSHRLLSYVYYFHARPNGFFGGELKLYDSRTENGVDMISREFHLITPKDNSIVFFPSATWHEVLPTYVPSGAFHDSRFTVNGWVRRTVT